MRPIRKLVAGLQAGTKAGKVPLKMKNGSQIAIIGGGPAGCFFALHLLHYARQEGIQLQVTVFEVRDFSQTGPQCCGKSAGLLSSELQQNLRSFDLPLPPNLIQNKINSYMLHLAGETIEISPPMPGQEIVTVQRGRGPRLAPLDRAVNFDEWLLKEVEQVGARIIKAFVQKLTLFDQTCPGKRPLVQVENQTHSFDLVVLANGINSRRLPISGLNYHPPKTETMVQDELDRFPGDNQQAHIYFGQLKEIVCGAVVPKGAITSISLLGSDLNLKAVSDFVTQIVPGQTIRQLCGCKPRIAISMARGYYTDRFVIIGDAAATRLYKDGIGSAFQTARRAAYVAIYHGISAADFRSRYAPLCQMIGLNNFFGRLLFTIWHATASVPTLTKLWLGALEYELTLPNEARRCHHGLWNMFTGDDTYQHIFFSLVNPQTLWLLLTVVWRLWVQRNLSHVLRNGD